jgi:tetratricopeptide (TPR) repeat protein
MTRGGKAALLISIAALAGCTATSTLTKARLIADPAAALLKGDDLAVARGELALNNVGLALEAFRKAQRAEPSNPEPLAGIAACYMAMGRFDLAQTNFEAALALAPRDVELLKGLAKTLDLQGQPGRAAEVRQEAQRDASEGPAAAPVTASATATTSSSVTVALPAPAAAVTSSVTVALPPPRPSAAQSEIDQNGPWLERLSPGEVALVTTRARKSSLQTKTTVTAALRWAPLSQPGTTPKVQVLNAARANGLAAAARAMLADRGWRNIIIGSAPVARQSSVIVYPRGQARIARRLAVELGIRTRTVGGSALVVVLGRDRVGTGRPLRRA